MNIRYSARARVQIELIHNYIAERNAVAASVVVAYIRQASIFQLTGRMLVILLTKKAFALSLSRVSLMLFFTK